MVVEIKHNGNEIYALHCDNCNDLFFEEHEGYSFYYSEDNLIEAASHDNWDIKEKHYCPECYSYEEDDVLILDENRPINSSNQGMFF